MKTLICSLLISLSACGPTIQRDYSGFELYVILFQDAAVERGVEIKSFRMPATIKFGIPDAADQIAKCTRTPKEGNHISVNKTLWDQMDEPCREALMMHELGHCTLNRRHVDDTRSIMFDVQPLKRCLLYENNRKEALDELFQYEVRY